MTISSPLMFKSSSIIPFALTTRTFLFPLPLLGSGSTIRVWVVLGVSEVLQKWFVRFFLPSFFSSLLRPPVISYGWGRRRNTRTYRPQGVCWGGNGYGRRRTSQEFKNLLMLSFEKKANPSGTTPSARLRRL